MNFTRRDFLRYSFVTGACVALSGCGRPVEHGLLSQYPMPEYLLPGQPVYFATSRGPDGIAVKCVEGRAIKMEGLPGHPVNLGKLSAEVQTAIPVHYHPDRLLQPQQAGKSITWDVAQDPLKAALTGGNGGLFIVDRLQGSRGTLILAVAKAIGARVWVLQFPSSETERRVIKALTGKAELPYYPLDQADYVVNFGRDFLVEGPLAIHYSHLYGQFRQGLNRNRGVMVSVSSRMNLSCSNADRWLPVRPGSEGWVAAAVGNLIGASRSGWPSIYANATAEKASELSGCPKDLIERLAKRLAGARKPLVIAGPDNSFDAASLAAMHSLSKLVSGTIATCETDLLPTLGELQPDPGVVLSTREALEGFDQGSWSSVWVFDCNPVYMLPASLKFAEKLKNVKTRIAFSCFANETTALCDVTLPSRNWMEEWGDCLVDAPFGQVYNLSQPVVKPRSDTRSVCDALITLTRAAGIKLAIPARALTFRDVLSQALGTRFDAAVSRGGLWSKSDTSFDRYHHDVALPPPPARSPGGEAPSGVSAWGRLEAAAAGALIEPNPRAQGKATLIASSSVNFGDGQRANVPWMQELPDPLTTVAWASWIEINPFGELGQSLKVKRGDLLEITGEGGAKLVGPAFPTQAVHVDAIAIPAGNGHAEGAYGRYTDDVVKPMNPMSALLGTPANPWASTQVTVTNTKKSQFIATFDRRIMGLEKATLPH